MNYSEEEVQSITSTLTNRVFNVNKANGRSIARVSDTSDSLKYKICFKDDKTFTVSVELKDDHLHMMFEETNIKDYQFLSDFFLSTLVSFKHQKGKLTAYFKIAQKNKNHQA